MSDKIQLAVGYIGVTRKGKRVEIVKCTGDTIYRWRGCNNETYTDCGRFSSNRKDARDIVRPLGNPINYNDGNWHRWGGDAECPVHVKTLVEVAYIDSDGDPDEVEMAAGQWMWNSTIEIILAFRVTKEYVEPRKPREFWLVKGYFHSSEPDDKDAIHVREVIK
tara:strand:- start:2797 stop:3288 length:492 start_codon:yes stop_codon:yes gene_type:complete